MAPTTSRSAASTEAPADRDSAGLHPRVRLVWAAGSLGFAAVLFLAGWAVVRFVLGRIPFAPSVGVTAVAGIAALVGLLGVAMALLRYRVWRYALQDDALYLERGVLTRVETAVPYVRVQHIDTRRGPIERIVGLSSVVVYTAGSRGADVTVPGLAPERARGLRDRLRDLAVASETDDAV